MTETGARTIRFWGPRLERLSKTQLRVLVARGRRSGMAPFLRDPYAMIAIRNELARRGAHAARS